MELNIKRLSTRTEIPQFAHNGDACFDLRVLIDDGDNNPFRFCNEQKCEVQDKDRFEDSEGQTVGIWIRPGESIIFHTGLACEMESCYVMKIYARSSTGIKKHLMLSNGVGIIDSSFRGEIMISLTNFGNTSILIRDGDRVAQAEICPVLPVNIVEVNELSSSERNTGGIGSTGNK